MVDKCVMTQLQQFSIFLEKTSRSCGNILYFYQHCQSDKLTLEVMLLMIEYLFMGKLWTTVAAEHVIEKSGMRMW